MQATPPLKQSIDHSDDLSALRQIADMGHRLDAVTGCLPRRCHEPGLVDIDQIEVGSLARERNRNRAADPRGSAGHQGLLSANVLHRAPNRFSRAQAVTGYAGTAPHAAGLDPQGRCIGARFWCAELMLKSLFPPTWQIANLPGRLEQYLTLSVVMGLFGPA